MLHLTSFFQNARKTNNPSNRINQLNKLNKNYSFIYNQNSDSYDFLYNNDETDEEDYEKNSTGYFGCFRDQKADRKFYNTMPSSKKIAQESDHVYWGLFEDSHLNKDDLDTTKTIQDVKATATDEAIFYFEPDKTTYNKNEMDSDSDFSSKLNGEADSAKHGAKKIVYDYKRSKFKIEAGKRDEMKIFIQSLEDREVQLKKEIIKKFDQNKLENCKLFNSEKSESEINLSQRIRRINFLHFSNRSNSNNLDESRTKSLIGSSPDSFSTFLTKSNSKNLKIEKNNFENFKNVFNTLSKLNKSINVFNGNYLNIDKSYLDHFVSFFNVNASLSDLNGLLYNLNKTINSNRIKNYKINQEKEQQAKQLKTTTISLCSNIYDMNQKPFGHGNHMTMLFEHSNVKIGFMALVDQSFFNKLNNFLSNNNSVHSFSNKMEYVDFVLEANRLAKELRLSGAHLIVALINFDSIDSEQRLLNESIGLDLVFSSQQQNENCERNDFNFTKFNNKWLIKSSNNFDSLSLVSLNLDAFNNNKIVDIAITKYFV